MRLLSAKIMSHCHSVITLLGTISYSTLFLRPCESCSNTISVMIQGASAPAGSYGGSDELQLLERSLAQSRDQPPYCGGGPIYVSGPRLRACMPELLRWVRRLLAPPAWALVCSHSFAGGGFTGRDLGRESSRKCSFRSDTGGLCLAQGHFQRVASRDRADSATRAPPEP